MTNNPSDNPSGTPEAAPGAVLAAVARDLNATPLDPARLAAAAQVAQAINAAVRTAADERLNMACTPWSLQTLYFAARSDAEKPLDERSRQP
ncbi:hypothetical protein [Xanthobacter sp. ZOL 2024]